MKERTRKGREGARWGVGGPHFLGELTESVVRGLEAGFRVARNRAEPRAGVCICDEQDGERERKRERKNGPESSRLAGASLPKEEGASGRS